MSKVSGPRGRMAETGSLETLRTKQVLALHEKHFAPLDAQGKARIIQEARLRGWDASWEVPLAA